MVQKWLQYHSKRMIKRYIAKKKIIILPVMQTGYCLDFMDKIDNEDDYYFIDLNHLLHPSEVIADIQYQIGDDQLKLKKITLFKRAFCVEMNRGTINSLSTILFSITTKSRVTYKATVLVQILAEANSISNNKRKPQCWIINQEPSLNYLQDNHIPWQEDDLVINATDRTVWIYQVIGKKQEWKLLFVLKGAVKPVNYLNREEESFIDEVILNKIDADQGKIYSNQKGDLTVEGTIKTNTIQTSNLISGQPLGDGIFFTTPGMLAGQSLFIGSGNAKPKNIYVGVEGCVSSKLISADYLQLSFLSIRELPKEVRHGTLVFCHDYPETACPVFLFANKNNPQTLEDWSLLFKPASKNEKIVQVTPSLTSDNVVELTSFTSFKKNNSVSENISNTNKPDFHLGIETFTRFYFNNLLLKSSEVDKISWDNLLVEQKQQQQLQGSGQQYYGLDSQSWCVPQSGLLHVKGYFIFEEEENKPKEPISYHAGDQLWIDIVRDHEDYVPINRSETIQKLTLVPYMNDVTHQICASPKVSFDISYPVSRDENIIFKLAYFQQKTAYQKTSCNLKVKQAVIELYMT